jgi:hypothetical protein
MTRHWLRLARRATLRATRSGIALRLGGESTKTAARESSDSISNRPQWATAAWLSSARARGRRSMNSMPQLSLMAEGVTALPVFDCTRERASNNWFERSRGSVLGGRRHRDFSLPQSCRSYLSAKGLKPTVPVRIRLAPGRRSLRGRTEQLLP